VLAVANPWQISGDDLLAGESAGASALGFGRGGAVGRLAAG